MLPRNIVTLIDAITLFQLASLAIALLLTRRGRKLSNRILSAYFIIQSQCVISSLIWRYFGWSVSHIPGLFFIIVSPLMLLGASLYFYTRSMTEPGFKFKYTDGLHLLPFFIHFGFYFTRFHRFDGETKQHLLLTRAYQTQLEGYLIDNVFFVLLLGYAAAIIWQLHKYNLRIRQVASGPKSGLHWLFIIILGFISIWISDITEYYLHWAIGSHTFLSQIPHPAIFLLTTAMVWKTLMQSDTFRDCRKTKIKPPMICVRNKKCTKIIGGATIK